MVSILAPAFKVWKILEKNNLKCNYKVNKSTIKVLYRYYKGIKFFKGITLFQLIKIDNEQNIRDN